jgi:hypothetical protein
MRIKGTAFRRPLSAAFAMDQLTRLNYGMFFAILVLPAWTALRLRSWKVSVPIGALLFWGWLNLYGEFVGDIDPSRVGGLGPAINFLFGLPFGAGYCAIWFVIRGVIRRPSSKLERNYVKLISLIVWSALISLCLCFPFMATALHHRSLEFYMPYVLIGVGPILLLSLAMVCSTVCEMYKCNNRVLSTEDANIGLHETSLSGRS